ncbi:T9SS sorting signal type C domain-containing protein [Flavobacterium sp. A45]|uniref:Ig-like domain-containing protein n=1 Tax=Flavobacterium sp. A45 TaxID=1945862 RepID=UPI0009864056|nr:T9SS sorting signal type C domain-containing protein [Flavobacterium sp. A45]OOG78800.1 hypothetical protein B0E44_00240 [Flavobacterium sp. A45]
MKKFYLNLQRYVSKAAISFWAVLILLVIGNSIFAQTTVNFTTPGSNTWTVPCGVTSLTVRAWGGGGAGGAATINPSGGSGGGGGGYSTYVVMVTPSQIINYSIGSGGIGGSGNGGDGGTTTILALTANGGTGGFQDNGTAGIGGTASGGTTNTSGNNGVTGTSTTGGAGGNSPTGGTGGLSITTQSIGNNGTSPGGGGGGGLLLSAGGPFNGGNGGNGQITITYTPPAIITVQPATPNPICVGSITPRTISVSPTGLSYQWRKNGVNLTAADNPPYNNVTGRTLQITSPPFSENGASFDVIVTNGQGCTETSNAVILTVVALPPPPTPVAPSSPITICNGTNINLNGTSAGNTIFWYPTAISTSSLGSSASGVNFSITPPDNTTTTYYAEAITPQNCISSSRTATGTVTKTAPPTINTQPVISGTVCEGSGTSTISINSTATTWQWRKDGVDLTNTGPYSGVTTATLTITDPTISDSGIYSVMLNGAGCGLLSGNITYTVNPRPSPPTFVTPSSPTVACTTAGTTPLNATSAGNTIDWYTIPTGGSTVGSSSSGIDFFVSAPTATFYYAESRDAATSCVSATRTATASVTSNVLPVIATQPVSPVATICAGAGTATISVGATGVTTYQWRKNGVNLTNVAPYSGVNSNILTITNPAISENGASFDVVLNNATCPVTSDAVILTVNDLPTTPTSVTPNSPTTFCSGSGSITLNATSAGNTIYWYTAATGGTSVGFSASGDNFSITPTITTTYYAEARNAVGCKSPTRTPTASITVNATPVVNIEFTENQDDNEYTINICGNIAAAENDIDVHSGNPGGGVNAPNFGPATGQWQVSYDNQATWVNAPGPTSTIPQYKFDPVYTTFESVAGTYYFRLIITHNGCPGISDVIKLNVIGDPTLTSGSVAGNQSSCPVPYTPAAFTSTAAATVGTTIPGYTLSYQWQSSTDNVNFTNISGATSATYAAPAISVTTYYRRYAIYGTAGGGCSAASNTITVSVGTLPAPIVGTITQPTCALATGSVALSGLPVGSWTINPGSIPGNTTSTTITGLAANTYNFTVTQSTCTSPATANVVINAQPITPAAPTASVTAQPNCATPQGTIVVTVPTPAANVTYTLTGTAPIVAAVTQTVATFANLNSGTYTVATTNTSSGCTSSNTTLTVNSVPPTPIPTLSSTAASCSADGTSTISNYLAGNTYVFTPPGPTVGVGGSISGMTVGTSYTVRGTNGSCTQSAASASFSNAAQLPTPAIPTLSSSAASCSADGTSTISNYLAGNTYTFTPAGPSAGAGGAISGMTVGTSYTVTATSGGCTSVASASFSNAAQLPTPAIPTLSSTAASCSADGTTTISNYLAGNTYTFTPAGPSVGVGGAISGMTLGTSYTVTATNGSCTSVDSASFSNAAQPTLPAVPSLTAGTITCNNVTANWTTIPNVTGYRIDVARDNIFTDIIPAYNNLLLGSGVVTENVTGLASGLTFYIRVRAENSCGASANSTTLTITTGSSPTTFTTALVQPNCVTATGQITVNGSDPSDEYSFDDGVTYQSSNVKNLLPAGTYYIKIRNTNGCETLATTVVLNAATTTTYSAGTWSNGNPDVNKKAIFASAYTLSADIEACSCEVNDLVNVTVNPGVSLVLENGLTVLGTGSIIFENNSNLIQTNNVVNTGNIEYRRNTTPVGKFDYTYWSSPVSPQTLLNVSPTTLFDKYYSWDAVAGTWKIEATGTVMEKGVGYIIRGPQGNATPAVHTASFIGIPNNGSISVSIAGAGLEYLIGNPYPSALDAEAFLAANTVLDGTIYFWTHNTPITPSGSFYVYNSNDYASFNAVGGTGTTAAAANTGINNSIPSGEIASGQAFFATSNALGTVTFENTMRVGVGGAILNNSQFFKGTKANTELKKHRVWLNLSNTEGAFKQLLIGYVTNATNGMDKRFDGKTMDSNTYIDFYSINDSNKLSIQGRALPFEILDQVPLGYRTTIEGTFSINIDQIDGILTKLPVFLEDKLTGTVVNLKKGAYSFSTAIGTFDDRFVLRYIDNSIKIPDFSNVNFEELVKKVLVSVKNRRIKINSFDQTIDNVTVYDLSRRKLYEKGNINSNEFNVPEFSSANQFLMVQIRLKNGKLVTEKVIF